MPPKKKKGNSAKKKASEHGEGERVDKSKADMGQKEQRHNLSKQLKIYKSSLIY